MVTLKFWKWFKKNPSSIETIVAETNAKVSLPPVKEDVDTSIRYPAMDFVLTTTVAELQLRPCKVYENHTIKFGNKIVEIAEDRPPHILDLNFRHFLFTRRQRILAYLLKLPKWQTVRCYTCEKEGEVTHDPNKTVMTEKQKMRIEKMIQLKGTATKAEIVQTILAGLKGKATWWEILGWGIIICVIVFFFLFAFQIQPNM